MAENGTNGKTDHTKYMGRGGMVSDAACEDCGRYALFGGQWIAPPAVNMLSLNPQQSVNATVVDGWAFCLNCGAHYEQDISAGKWVRLDTTADK